MSDKEESVYWIWLSSEIYPQYQETFCTTFCDKHKFSYCVAEFTKTFLIQKQIKSAKIEISGDTIYRLLLNDSFLGTGPVAAGGDYGNQLPMPKTYYSTYQPNLQLGENTLLVQIQLGPTVMTEYSSGHGGLYLICQIEFYDGTTQTIQADETWQARLNSSYTGILQYNALIKPSKWENAVITQNIWTLAPSPIPILAEQFITQSEIFIHKEYQQRFRFDGTAIHITKGSPVTFTVKFDKIYSAYSSLEYMGSADVKILLKFQELIGRTDRTETIITSQHLKYRGWMLQSIGYIEVTVSNFKNEDIVIDNLGAVFTCYPVESSGDFTCSDDELDKIYQLGKWTLQICRQTLHLDSPIHQETLGCTGDYFIASLINYYTFGDARLTRFDISRTADYLRVTGGKMFHTSYSLIWLQMLADYYRYTADISIVHESIDAMHILLERFHLYVGESGLIDNPPNYMFIDWVVVDDYNLHHPPKALGQGSLTAFYYKALQEASYLCNVIHDKKSGIYQSRAKQIKLAFNANLWDEEKQLYFDGLSTPDDADQWKPENPQKRYYSQHTNTLAVLYDLTDEQKAKSIMEAVILSDSLIQAQPYFMHYVFEALYQASLFPKYGISQIKRWTALVNECDRGLKEVWSGFDCDYSHAWGATPTYQLPSKILGLKIIESGYKKISLDVQLFGLKHAHIKVPTPFGMIDARLYSDQPSQIDIPKKIAIDFIKGLN